MSGDDPWLHTPPRESASFDRHTIAEIHRAVPVPLVLHGSSGVPDRDLAAAIRAGITKINIATQLNKVFTAAIRDCLAGDAAMVDPRRYGSAGRDAIAPEVARLLSVISVGNVGQEGPPEPAAELSRDGRRRR